MIFGGQNKRSEDTNISKQEALECFNCIHYENKIGHLGPRPGKDFINAAAYGDNVFGIIPFTLSNGNRRFLIAVGDGEITDEAAPNAVYNFGTYTPRSGITPLELSGTTSLTISDGVTAWGVETSTVNLLNNDSFTTTETSSVVYVSYPLFIEVTATTSLYPLVIRAELITSGGDQSVATKNINVVSGEVDYFKMDYNGTVPLMGGGTLSSGVTITGIKWSVETTFVTATLEFDATMVFGGQIFIENNA